MTNQTKNILVLWPDVRTHCYISLAFVYMPDPMHAPDAYTHRYSSSE